MRVSIAGTHDSLVFQSNVSILRSSTLVPGSEIHALDMLGLYALSVIEYFFI